MSASKAKLFTIGGSQAVRIPKALRLPGTQVSIRKVGQALMIEPVAEDEWAWLSELPPPDPDFMKDGRDERPQHRPEIDDFFKR
jgi:antitoxin VapB